MSSSNEEFATIVQKFIDIDDQLKSVGSQVKDMKTNKQTLEKRIMEHMESNDIPETSIKSDKIKLLKTKSSSPFNKNIVLESAVELFGQGEADRLLAHIENKKEFIEKNKIKRLSEKKRKAGE